MTIPLVLSNVRPDFESLLLQLQIYLQGTNAWQDLQTSSTGETLMEMMAAVGAMNQFGIESAARETTLTTAVRDSSIYAITRMLGVRIHRKYPASVTVNISRIDSSVSFALPAYTQLTVNGQNFFNRNTLMFAQGSLTAAERLFYGPVKAFVDGTHFRLDISALNVTVLRVGDTFNLVINSGADMGQIKAIKYVGGNVGEDLFALADGETPFTQLASVRVSVMSSIVQLFEGSITTESFTSDGSGFRQIYLAQTNFQVSDVDVNVTVTNIDGTVITWGQITDGMWSAGSTDNVFYDSTSGLGETIIAFGDGTNGAIPLLGSTINVKYVITQGQAANNGLSALDVTCTNYNWLSGKTASVISGGADQKPSNYYRFMAPLIFKARNRGVTDSDYLAVSLDYPGIISANVMAQRDIAPHDLRWMNQLRICLLPADPNSMSLTAPEWDEFLAYMKKKRHAAVNIVTINPTSQNAEIELTLALKKEYIPSTVLPNAEAKVNALFSRQSDTLGRRIAVSDVVKAAMVEGIDYVEVNKCKLTNDTIAVTDLLPVDGTYFIKLASYLVNTTYSERSIYGDGSS
jgi:hypothetical protein